MDPSNDTTQKPQPDPWPQFSLRGLMLFVTVAAIFFGAIALLVPLVVTSTDQHWGMQQCNNNLRQLGLAMMLYEAKHHSFPPAYVTDAHGTRLYSWRLIVADELGRADLAALANTEEPWDGPHNRTIAKESLLVLHCPRDKGDPTTTNYLAVVGPNTAWPGAVGRKLSEIKNPAKTILLVESADSGINWAEPRDLDINKMSFRINQPSQPPGQSIRSHHFEKGANVLFADGHVEFLDEGTDPNKIRSMLDVRNP